MIPSFYQYPIVWERRGGTMQTIKRQTRNRGSYLIIMMMIVQLWHLFFRLEFMLKGQDRI